MAKKNITGMGLDDVKGPPSKGDVFDTLMVLSVAALVTGIALLAWTLSEYGWAVTAQ